MRKVHKDKAERILDFLCTNVLTGKKEQDREIASIALTTVIGEISGQELSCLIVRQIVPKMLQGMQAQVSRLLLLHIPHDVHELLISAWAGTPVKQTVPAGPG